MGTKSATTTLFPASLRAQIDTLMGRLNAHDAPTASRAGSIAQLAYEMGGVLNYSEDRSRRLALAGFLHDIGKLQVDPSMLNWPEELDDKQWAVMCSHTNIEGLLPEEIKEYLGAEITGITDHHEFFSGRGYPTGIVNAEPVNPSQIIGVASSYISMTSPVSWRPAMTRDKAMAELSEESGGLWDPQVVDACKKVVSRVPVANKPAKNKKQPIPAKVLAALGPIPISGENMKRRLRWLLPVAGAVLIVGALGLLLPKEKSPSLQSAANNFDPTNSKLNPALPGLPNILEGDVNSPDLSTLADPLDLTDTTGTTGTTGVPYHSPGTNPPGTPGTNPPGTNPPGTNPPGTTPTTSHSPTTTKSPTTVKTTTTIKPTTTTLRTLATPPSGWKSYGVTSGCSIWVNLAEGKNDPNYQMSATTWTRHEQSGDFCSTIETKVVFYGQVPQTKEATLGNSSAVQATISSTAPGAKVNYAIYYVKTVAGKCFAAQFTASYDAGGNMTGGTFSTSGSCPA